MTLGYYENFPANVHRVESFNSNLSNKQLQQKLIQVLYDLNHSEFTFEEVNNPAVKNGKVIFEFGLAESRDFNYIDAEELKKTLDFLAKERFQSMDFFCSVRYYKRHGEKTTALKFDYYMLRTVFDKNLFEVQVFHERGPRYVSPEELTTFVFTKINEASDRNRKILKKSNS